MNNEAQEFYRIWKKYSTCEKKNGPSLQMVGQKMNEGVASIK